MAFDPKAHLIQLSRRVKDPITGQWTTRVDDYLEVRWRVVWFREQYPHSRIETEEVCVDLDQGYARYKAIVSDGDGGLATGYGTEYRKPFEDFVEKAGTRAVGRALALLGFGTQFIGEELSEGDHVADAPVASAHGDISSPEVPPAATDGHQLVTPQRPTAEDIDRLFDVAQVCQEPKDLFGRRLREIMGLPGEARISKKFLGEAMTVTQYHAALAYYERMLKAQIEEDVPDGAETPQHPVAQPAQAAAGEDIPEVPFGSPSAAEGTPTTGRPGQPLRAPAAVPAPDAPVVATSEQLRALRALALKVDPTGKAERDVLQSFAHFPRGMPLKTYAEVHDRLTRRLGEAKGGLALVEA
jgi:hypothetical protein